MEESINLFKLTQGVNDLIFRLVKENNNDSNTVKIGEVMHGVCDYLQTDFNVFKNGEFDSLLKKSWRKRSKIDKLCNVNNLYSVMVSSGWTSPHICILSSILNLRIHQIGDIAIEKYSDVVKNENGKINPLKKYVARDLMQPSPIQNTSL